MCADNTRITVTNRAFIQPKCDEDGFVSTNNETVFINRVVYRRTEEHAQSRIQLFIAQSEFDRSISVVVKGAEDIKSVTFPGTIRDAHSTVFEKSAQLRSVVLNEGLERLEGRGCHNDQYCGIFIGIPV